MSPSELLSIAQLSISPMPRPSPQVSFQTIRSLLCTVMLSTSPAHVFPPFSYHTSLLWGQKSTYISENILPKTGRYFFMNATAQEINK